MSFVYASLCSSFALPCFICDIISISLPGTEGELGFIARQQWQTGHHQYV